MLTFKVNSLEVSTNEFQQASFEIIYDRIQKKYTNRFSGFLPTDKAKDVVDLLTDNLNNFVDVFYGADYSLSNAKVVFVNADIATNQCRIEIEQITE